jgi:hypothetical protein
MPTLLGHVPLSRIEDVPAFTVDDNPGEKSARTFCAAHETGVMRVASEYS